jgi:predicted ribosome quality control (RQC) complex YloA/Tae2 family protein
MRVVIDTRKTVEQNAADHYERAKKAKKKIEGTKRAIAKAREMLAREAAGSIAKEVAHVSRAPARKREWFESFRWFLTSDGLLCVGGRDASTNETVVKKHAAPTDLVFHTDMAGSPFVVLKTDGKEIADAIKQEVAVFSAAMSRAWKSGAGTTEVFCTRPEQLSKTPNSGESLGKGAFVVRGHVEYFRPAMAFAIGKDHSGRVMGGPPAAVKAHCPDAFVIHQGEDKPSDVAKRLARALEVTPDEIIRSLPPGNVKLGAKF